MLCLYVVLYHPCTQRSRETDNVFQLLKLNQTVSHIYENFSNIFVAEVSTWSVWHYLEGLLITHSHKEYHTGVVSSVLMSLYAQEEHCIWVVSLVLDILCPGWCCTLAYRFWQIFLMIITGKVMSSFSSAVVQESRTTCNSVLSYIKDGGHVLAESWFCKHALHCFLAIKIWWLYPSFV